MTRISLDMLQPRRPEHPPAQPAQSAPSPSAAAVALLERLPSLERAVFVLREIFGCGPPEIAAALGRTQAACDRLAAAVPRAGDGRGTDRWPAAVFRDREGTVLCALAFDVLEGRITTIRWLTRPYPHPHPHTHTYSSRPTPAP